MRATLADLLFGDAACGNSAAATLSTAHAWDDAVALAARWHVAGALLHHVQPLNVPAPVRATLRRLSAAACAHSTLTLHRAVGVSTTLESAGISTIAVKGVAAIAQLYGSPAVRLAGDFDCFVAERDVRDAEHVLLASGHVSQDIPFDEHVRRVDASPRLHNYARTYTRDGFEVDLHWRLGPKPPAPLQFSTLLARSAVVAAAGHQLRVPHPVDAQLLTVHHAMRGAFSTTTTLKDIGDLAAWWTLAPHVWDLDELIDTANACALGSSLLALWTIVAGRNPAHPIVDGAARLRDSLPTSERRAGPRLARFFESQLVHGDYAARTVELFALPKLAVSAVAETRRRMDAAHAAHEPAGSSSTVDAPSFAKRVAGIASRTWRVARELADLRQLGAYATLARTQSRFR